MSFRSLLNRTCSVWEIARGASNGVGGWAMTDTSGAADSLLVPCRIQPAGRSDVLRFERQDLSVQYVMYALYDAPIARGWAIKLDGSDPPGSTVRLNVVDTEHPSISTHHMKVFLTSKKRRGT